MMLFRLEKLEQISGSKELKANHNSADDGDFFLRVGTNIRKQRIESKSQLTLFLLFESQGWNKYQEAKN